MLCSEFRTDLFSSLSMYFSYVPSIIFSFFNRPLFLNLLFKQILIQYYSILFNRVLCRGVRRARGSVRLRGPPRWILAKDTIE